MSVKQTEEYEALKERLFELVDKVDELWDSATNCKDFINRTKELRLEIGGIKSRMQLIKVPKLSPIRSYGDKMTIREFVECCKEGLFIDYDGVGYYATDDQESDIFILPSHVSMGMVRTDFTHVIWFNR